MARRARGRFACRAGEPWLKKAINWRARAHGLNLDAQVGELEAC